MNDQPKCQVCETTFEPSGGKLCPGCLSKRKTELPKDKLEKNLGDMQEDIYDLLVAQIGKENWTMFINAMYDDRPNQLATALFIELSKKLDPD